jgi:hypothetical protein
VQKFHTVTGVEFCFITFAQRMKKILIILLLSVLFLLQNEPSKAQCSICTKTAEQLGDEPARGLNAGILYLAFAPFAIVGILGWRWWKRNRSME